MGFSSPKYFSLISRVIIMACGTLKAVFGSPMINSKEKTSKKVVSAANTFFSSNLISSYSTEKVGFDMFGPKTGVRLVAFSTSGKSLTIARAMGCGVLVWGTDEYKSIL